MHNASPEFVNPYPSEPSLPVSVGNEQQNVQRLEKLQNAFGNATGWEVQWAVLEVPPREQNGISQKREHSGRPTFSLKPLPPRDSLAQDTTQRHVRLVSEEAAVQLAESVSELLGEIAQLERTLWEREAELATAVPVVASPMDKKNLAFRLQAVLRAGVEAVGADAAGLYLLDDGTTCLKLRAVWGLPIRKLAEPARLLRGALADLEALLGHAVVLDDVVRMPHWQVPEKGFGAAVCVPVSTHSTVLGTLWVFSKEPRDFTPQQTNILEVISGRIAAELEREVLLVEAAAAQPWREHLYQLQRWHEEQAGWNLPCLEAWDIGLWKESGEAGWGEFFQWFPWGKPWIGIAIGRVAEQGLRAVMEAVRVRSVLQAHAPSILQPHRLLRLTQQTLGNDSFREVESSIWLGRLATSKKGSSSGAQLIYTLAGRMGLLVLSPQGWKSLSETIMPLGRQTGTLDQKTVRSSEKESFLPKATGKYTSRRCRLRPGEALVIFPAIETAPPLQEAASSGRPGSTLRGNPMREIERQLAEHLLPHLHWPAPRLAELAQNFLDKVARDVGPLPKSLYVIKAK